MREYHKGEYTLSDRQREFLGRVDEALRGLNSQTGAQAEDWDLALAEWAVDDGGTVLATLIVDLQNTVIKQVVSCAATGTQESAMLLKKSIQGDLLFVASVMVAATRAAYEAEALEKSIGEPQS